MRTVYRRSERRRLVTPTAMFSAITTLALFLIVPLANLLDDYRSGDPNLAAIDPSLPPPPPPPAEPPPPPDTEKEEVEPELVEEPPPLTLAQLEMTLNSGMGNAIGAGFASFDASFDAVAEIRLFEVSDLDRKPIALSTINPVHPFDLKQSGVEGTATVMFIVDENGNVRDAKATDFTHPQFGAATVSAVRNWKFQPGEKDGRPVNTIVRQRVSFAL